MLKSPVASHITRAISAHLRHNTRAVRFTAMAQSQPRPTTLNFITGNANKLKEVQAILDGVIELQSWDVKGLDEIQGTIEEIARDKCSRAAERVSVLLF